MRSQLSIVGFYSWANGILPTLTFCKGLPMFSFSSFSVSGCKLGCLIHIDLIIGGSNFILPHVDTQLFQAPFVEDATFSSVCFCYYCFGCCFCFVLESFLVSGVVLWVLPPFQVSGSSGYKNSSLGLLFSIGLHVCVYASTTLFLLLELYYILKSAIEIPTAFFLLLRFSLALSSLLVSYEHQDGIFIFL